VSPATWIPVLWIAIIGSRFVSQWLQLGNPGATQNVTDGSPLDAAYFMFVILCALIVLVRRRIKLAEIVRNNAWLFAFFLFSFISIAWSDFPFIAFKRFVKTMGHPLVALVILTDPNPSSALRAVLRRCAFFLLPTSILFIKYLPEYGRGFDSWLGTAYNQGVMITKNDLGCMTMIFSIFFVWVLLSRRNLADVRSRRIEMLASLGLLSMALWLLAISDSATSLMCMVLGTAVMLALGLPFVNKRYVGTYVVTAIALVILTEVSFGVYATVIEMLGRDPNLTDRTDVWIDALKLQPNVVLGAGFESFWLGSRLEAMWAKWWWRPSQAHNGYIETYLNLGAVGVFLLTGMLVSTFRKICARLESDFEIGRLRLAFLFVLIAFNYTEASFKALHPMWTVFYLIALDYPKRSTSAAPSDAEAGGRRRREPKRVIRYGEQVVGRSRT